VPQPKWISAPDGDGVERIRCNRLLGGVIKT